jgi:hypothetical protein
MVAMLARFELVILNLHPFPRGMIFESSSSSNRLVAFVDDVASTSLLWILFLYY